MLKKFLALTFSIIFSSMTFAESSLTGNWITLNEKNQKSSIVEVYEQNGKFSAKVLEVLPQKGVKKNPICKKCPGDFKNKPIKGLVLLWGLSPADNNSWENGKALDPKTGKILNTKATLSTDGKTLKLKHSLGFFSTTRTWLKSN